MEQQQEVNPETLAEEMQQKIEQQAAEKEKKLFSIFKELEVIFQGHGCSTDEVLHIAINFLGSIVSEAQNPHAGVIQCFDLMRNSTDFYRQKKATEKAMAMQTPAESKDDSEKLEV